MPHASFVTMTTEVRATAWRLLLLAGRDGRRQFRPIESLAIGDARTSIFLSVLTAVFHVYLG